jgi:hypothetical protein
LVEWVTKQQTIYRQKYHTWNRQQTTYRRHSPSWFSLSIEFNNVFMLLRCD